MTTSEHEQEQRQVAEDLAALDEATDNLIAKLGACAEHVQAGRLSENAVLAKVMELNAKMMAS